MQPRNDRNLGVTKFCLAMEEHRRTDAGRVRTAKELVTQFFPFDEKGAVDHLFKHIPKTVRGPVLSHWGIRGAKSAQRDDDDRVRLCVYDAMQAGDIDENIFEDGITSQIAIDWLPLQEWWGFWRSGKLTGAVIQKALATARELGLFDDTWFLTHVEGRGGKLKGTDIICDTLAKDQIVAWIRKLHESGDGSPSGLVSALGWETILTKTAQDALLFALDQLAKKIGLHVPEASVTAEPAPKSSGNEAPTGRHDKLADAAPANPRPTVSAPIEVLEAARASSKAASAIPQPEDSGFEVAIPDFPAVDEPAEMESTTNAPDGDVEPPSIPSGVERSVWSQQQTDESPKLAEARAAMMAMLNQNTEGAEGGSGVASERDVWEEDSEVPAKPSSLEWGDTNDEGGPAPAVEGEPTTEHANLTSGPGEPKVSGTQAVAPSGEGGGLPKAAPPPLPKRNAPRPS